MDFPVSIVEAASASDVVSQWFADCGVEEDCSASETLYTFFANPLTPTTFRLQFPAFASTELYPDMMVQFYITMAAKMLNPGRWGNMLQEGYALWTAHFLAMDRIASTTPGGAGGIPGTAVGVINSGSVDKVSYGKDIEAIMEDGAGHWGMTTYGLMYLRFAKMFGAGPLHIGGNPNGPPAGNPILGPFSDSAYLYANGYGGGLVQGNTAQAWPGPFPGLPISNS